MLVWLCQVRIIAPDDGYYALAARLVIQGRLPYLDFFYPQMPLLPYVYGAWIYIFGNSWIGVRLLSSIFVIALAWLVFKKTEQELGTRCGYIATSLLIFNPLVIFWFQIVQTYALSSFLLFASYYLLTSKPIPRLRGSALLFALAVQTRLFFIGLLPIFIGIIWLRDRQKLSAAIQFLVVFTVSCIPTLLLCSYDPQTFWFNNMGYHLIRSKLSFSDGLEAKYELVKVLLGVNSAGKFEGIQFPLLFWGALIWAGANLICLRSEKDKMVSSLLALAIALGLFFLSLLPTPAYIQYFGVLIPYLVIPCSMLICQIFANSSHNILRRALASALIFLFGLSYMHSLPSDIERYTVTGERLMGLVRANKGDSNAVSVSKLDSIRSVSRKIDELLPSGGVVLSMWPGYIFETKSFPLAGVENHFAADIAAKLPSHLHQRFHVMSKREMAQAIARRVPDAVVLTPRNKTRNVSKALSSGEYRLVSAVGRVKIYSK